MLECVCAKASPLSATLFSLNALDMDMHKSPKSDPNLLWRTKHFLWVSLKISSWNASEWSTKTWSRPQWDEKWKFSLRWGGELNFVVPQKCWAVTWWPLVVLWRLTRTAQSFPYRLVLPGPAGFDINTSLWLTEALALGWAPGASAVHSALLLACWFTVPGGCLLIHFPSQFAHRAPRKPSSSNIFALWFPEEPMKKNKASRSLHLFQLMCGGPVSLLWSRPLGGKQRAAVSQAPCGCSISPLSRSG